MTPKELSVWDVMNGVSEEDAKQVEVEQGTPFPENVVIDDFGTWDEAWDGLIPETTTGSYRNLTVGYPSLDRMYPVDEDELDQVIHTRVVCWDLNTGERRTLNPRYVLRIYDDHYELLEETSGRSCEISAERLLYDQDDAPPSACVTPSGEVLRFDEVIEVAQPH